MKSDSKKVNCDGTVNPEPLLGTGADYDQEDRDAKIPESLIKYTKSHIGTK